MFLYINLLLLYLLYSKPFFDLHTILTSYKSNLIYIFKRWKSSVRISCVMMSSCVKLLLRWPSSQAWDWSSVYLSVPGLPGNATRHIPLYLYLSYQYKRPELMFHDYSKGTFNLFPYIFICFDRMNIRYEIT